MGNRRKNKHKQQAAGANPTPQTTHCSEIPGSSQPGRTILPPLGRYVVERVDPSAPPRLALSPPVPPTAKAPSKNNKKKRKGAELARSPSPERRKRARPDIDTYRPALVDRVTVAPETRFDMPKKNPDHIENPNAMPLGVRTNKTFGAPPWSHDPGTSDTPATSEPTHLERHERSGSHQDREHPREQATQTMAYGQYQSAVTNSEHLHSSLYPPRPDTPPRDSESFHHVQSRDWSQLNSSHSAYPGAYGAPVSSPSYNDPKVRSLSSPAYCPSFIPPPGHPDYIDYRERGRERERERGRPNPLIDAYRPSYVPPPGHPEYIDYRDRDKRGDYGRDRRDGYDRDRRDDYGRVRRDDYDRYRRDEYDRYRSRSPPPRTANGRRAPDPWPPRPYHRDARNAYGSGPGLENVSPQRRDAGSYDRRENEDRAVQRSGYGSRTEESYGYSSEVKDDGKKEEKEEDEKEVSPPSVGDKPLPALKNAYWEKYRARKGGVQRF